MANSLEREILLEGWRNLAVKFSGSVDTADFTQAPALTLNDSFSNDPFATLVGYRVDEVEWTITSDLQVVAEWEGGQKLATMSQQGELCAKDFGGLQPDREHPGYTGAINLKSQGFVPGSKAEFTILFRLVKKYER